MSFWGYVGEVLFWIIRVIFFSICVFGLHTFFYPIFKGGSLDNKEKEIDDNEFEEHIKTYKTLLKGLSLFVSLVIISLLVTIIYYWEEIKKVIPYILIGFLIGFIVHYLFPLRKDDELNKKGLFFLLNQSQNYFILL